MEKQRPELIKGNYPLDKSIQMEEAKEDLTTQFEREALKRLGGSIAFVSKKKFLYNPEAETSETDSADTAKG